MDKSRKQGENMYKISVLFLILSLISCTGNRNEAITTRSANLEDIDLTSPAGKEFVANNCVSEDFAQGQDDNVYGLRCIDGKSLLIKTSKKGSLVNTSAISDSENIKIASDVDFINKYYSPSYTVLERKGDDKKIPFLLKFFQEGEDFTGNRDTEYRIVFKTVGDHLVLFKGSKNLQDIPYTERTSLKVWQSRSGKIKDYGCENSGKKKCIDKDKVKKGDYYLAPFIAYPIEYCNPETVLNANNEKTRKSRLKCVDSHLLAGDYIKVSLSRKKNNYDYKKDLKLDFFPADYFKGDWYFSIGLVESPTEVGEKSTSDARLVKIQFQPKQLFIVDNSGKSDISDSDKEAVFKLPVEWRDFEVAQSGNGKWSNFGEREKKNDDDDIKSPYLSLGLTDIKTLSTPLEEINLSWAALRGLEIESKIEQLEAIRIEKNYLSFSYKATLVVDNRFPSFFKKLLHGKQAKWTISLLRLDSKSEGSEGFVSRKFFLKDFLDSRVFGVFPIFSQKIKEVGEIAEEEVYDHARMTRFNLLLTEDEKKAPRPEKPFKTLKWYFSKNSTKDPEYRAVAKKAVDIYDRAFRYISNGKIQVELVEEEDKELGDLRYNLINLVEKDANIESGILGWGPSYANPNTGEIIGTTSNIFITKEKQSWFNIVNRYIRYELFEKDQNTSADNSAHVVTSHTRAVIEDKCGKGEIEEGNVVKFVKENKPKVTDKTLKRSDQLQNRESILACAKKMLLYRSLLSLILHEMGHNFGLTHNFKASADEKNYYHTPKEIKKIYGDDFKFNEEVLAKSSSVMDYVFSTLYPSMEYLGKYDLGALRYLYLDELEGKNEEVISLDINLDLKKQSALTAKQLEKSKDYLHCPDRFQMKEVFCMPFDYGATPKDIVENNNLGLKQLLNHLRYRYDRAEYKPVDFSRMIVPLFRVNLLYYRKWEILRDNYLINRSFDPVYKLNDPDSIDRYKTIIEEGNIPGTEYALYYPLREAIFKSLMEVMDYEEMTCHVSENATGKRHQLALEDIKFFFENEEGREVENCESFNDVFKTAGLNLEHQTGFEDFISYYPYHSNNRINRASVSPISYIFIPPGFVSPLKGIDSKFMSWVNEPDLLRELHLKTEQSINWEKNRTNVEALKSEIFLSSYKSSLKLVSDETEEEQEIERELINYSFGFRKYILEVGHDLSFNNLVEKPLAEHKSVDNPFLIESYKEYINHEVPSEYRGSFLNYLRTQKKNEVIITHDGTNKSLLITPYQKDSFSARMIQEYNDRVGNACENECGEMNLKALNNRIKNEKKPSLVDKVNKLALERYTTELLKRIEKEAR